MLIRRLVIASITLTVIVAGCLSFPPSGFNPENLPERDSEGAQLVAMYCAQCHNLAPPNYHTAQEWPEVVDRMRKYKHEDGQKMLTDSERELVVQYLQQFSQAAR